MFRKRISGKVMSAYGRIFVEDVTASEYYFETLSGVSRMVPESP
jgi:hypothetical protein